jgi:hypothetical protein
MFSASSCRLTREDSFCRPGRSSSCQPTERRQRSHVHHETEALGITWVILRHETAVSLPDELFRVAETVARRLRVSRSELYARAIAEFLKGQQENAITERLNHVYSRRVAKLDLGLHRAQLKSLAK